MRGGGNTGWDDSSGNRSQPQSQSQPQAHTQAQNEVHAQAQAQARGQGIPVVDLSCSDAEAAALIKVACEGPGFFHLVGHGVADALLQRVFAKIEGLFALTPEEKLRLKQDKNNRGYTALEEEVLDPERQTARGDTKEGYYIGVEIPDDHPCAHLPLHGPNQWPRDGLLPGFRPCMEEYFAECLRVCLRLLGLMALALGLPQNFFHQKGRFDQPVATLRPLHYSTEPSCPEEGVYGCGAHTDYGMVTLLAVRGPGLQICCTADALVPQWEAVEAVEGAFVVNVGDMLERWTNGHWRSTLHRVITPPDAPRDRYSIPFFFEPNFECVVECLPTCTSPDDPPRYPPTKFGDHILNMYKKTHMDLDESIKQLGHSQ